MQADVLYTLSPVPVSRRLAPAFSRPCPPCILKLPLMVLAAVPVVMLETLKAVALVIVACFPLRVVLRSTPLR